MGKPPAYRVGRAMEKEFGTNTVVSLRRINRRIDVSLDISELWLTLGGMDKVNEYDKTDRNGQPYKAYELLDGWEDEITMPDEEEEYVYRESPDEQNTFAEFKA